MIRHGEKINDKHTGLSGLGEKRAKYISEKFSSSNYGIKKIYAPRYYKNGRRKRAYDTVNPLAKRLKLKVDTSCERNPTKCIYSLGT